MAKRKTAEERAAEKQAEDDRWVENLLSDAPPLSENQIRSLRRILFSSVNAPEDDK